MTDINQRRVCLIDDDPVYTFVVKKILKHIRQSNQLINFPNGELALNWLKSNMSESSVLPELILLDISMPVMNGFEFVESFETLPVEKKQGISIFMLSSSINENDIAKVRGYSSIKQFINKPLTANSIAGVLEKI